MIWFGGVVAAVAALLWLAVPAGAATAGSAVSGTENFQVVSTSSTASTLSAIVTGVFTAGGVDHPGRTADTLVFPKGSFKVTHKGTTTSSLNPKTCLLTVSGPATITLSGGTGAYVGISGSGRAQLSILAIAARSGGKCSTTLPPVTFQQIIKGTAQVSL